MGQCPHQWSTDSLSQESQKQNDLEMKLANVQSPPQGIPSAKSSANSSLASGILGQIRKSILKKPSKNKGLIDFENMLEDYRKRNEFSWPYTMMQVEDMMFLDRNRLVSLEYVFY